MASGGTRPIATWRVASFKHRTKDSRSGSPAIPIASSRWRRSRCSIPDLAAQQLEDGVKRLGLRGASIGGHVNGEDLSLPKYDPFWAKAAELGVPVVMHPGGADNIIKDGALRGRGDLGNIIGNPLETTYFLSRLIFDGTLRQVPGPACRAARTPAAICRHISGRTEAACVVRDNANCANKRKPSEYLKSQIMVDTMVFSDEGLRHLVAEMGVGQVVYGTDVPFNWPVTVDLVLNASFLSDADKTAILSGNLMKLLKISWRYADAVRSADAVPA